MNATDIAIVGAGPTGLTLAAELQRLGVSALIVDKLAAGENTSRAVAVHAGTLEALEPLGVTPELLRNGVIVPTFRVRDRSRILLTVNFQDLKTPYPFTLMCPQDRTEAILLQRLQSLGGRVERPYEVNDVRPAADGVDVRLNGSGETNAIHAKWVVGCDGAHSVVREKAAIAFEGGAYEQSFMLADVEMDWPLDREEVSLFLAEQGMVLVAPLPGGHFRIVATVEQAPAEPSIADFQSILEERGPQEGALRIRRMAWSSRFHIQHRVARVLRQGHILLAGDAAHVHSPAGGQGMNTGIQDAASLAKALQLTLGGDHTALNQWQKERLKIAHSVVDMTDRMTKMATTSSPILKLVRNTAMELIGGIPFVQHELAERLAELNNGVTMAPDAAQNS